MRYALTAAAARSTLLNNRPRCARLSIQMSACLAIVIALPAIPRVALGATTDVAGTIHEDTLWSGQVVVTGDVRIIGATVRVEPGSTIQFVPPTAATFGPRIQLATPSFARDRQTPSARLILAGTRERPIVVETLPGKPPGAIVAEASTRGSVIARHVTFRRLGPPLSTQLANPAIRLQLTAPDNDLWLEDCRFESCGPVQAEFFGPGAGAHIEQCTFANTAGRTALVLTGAGSGLKIVLDNIADAAFQIECPQVLIQRNVLIGQLASIAIPTASPHAVWIDGNYIHCTATEDDGRYVLKCETAEAVVTRNLLIGGTYVIETAPRTVAANILIGVAGLRARFDLPGFKAQLRESTTSTHYLVANLPPRAVLTDNYFVGPAYAAVATSTSASLPAGQRAEEPTIEHNFFDGWGAARRAVHFNLLAPETLRAALTHNVIVRYLSAPVCDQAAKPDTLAKVGPNLFAEVPQPAYEKVANVTDLAPGDRRLAGFDQLGLEPSPGTQPAGSLDESLAARRLTVAQARQQWLAAYRPRPDSPLAAEDPAARLGPRPQ